MSFERSGNPYGGPFLRSHEHGRRESAQDGSAGMHIDSFIVDASIFAASQASWSRDVAFSVALNQNSSPRFAVEG